MLLVTKEHGCNKNKSHIGSERHRNIYIKFHKQNVNDFILEMSQKGAGGFKGGKSRFIEREQRKRDIYLEQVTSSEFLFNNNCNCYYYYLFMFT